MAEPYFLTQEDIDRLQLLDAVAGDQASLTDLEMLKSGTKVVPSNQPVTPLPDGQPQSVPSQSAPRTSTMGSMTAPSTAQDDPYGNLSKTQRRMLAFGAIHDAGLALQGKAGTMVPALLEDFTDRADQARKAAAARQELELRQRLLGGFGVSGGAGGVGMQEMSIGQLQALQQEVLQAAILYPDSAQSYKLQLDTIASRIEELKQEQASVQDTAASAKTVMNTVGDLAEAVASDPSITGPLGMLLGALPFTAAGEARLDLQTLKANIAFDTLKNIKAAGGTLGSVSAPELALLEARVANLDLNRGKAAVLRSLKEIDDFYAQIIVNAYNKATSEGVKQLDQMLGGRPDWINGAQPTDIQQFTFENAPVGGLVYDAEDGRVFKYNGGDRGEEESWTEVKK